MSESETQLIQSLEQALEESRRLRQELKLGPMESPEGRRPAGGAQTRQEETD